MGDKVLDLFITIYEPKSACTKTERCYGLL